MASYTSLQDLVQSFENPSRDPAKLNYHYDPTHTASGLYQITDTTWRGYAPGAGVDTSQYPSAASAPASAQDNVFGLIVGARGLADWTCPGCNPPLNAYLAANPDASNLPLFANGAASGSSSLGGDGGASVGAGGPGSITQPGSVADKAGGWFNSLGEWFASIAPRAVLFVVAIVLLFGAFYLFGTNREQSS